ncbi:hypothetical protein [Nocardia seriolae]|uniref:Uncharacterized protein n=1 Tax=Nocardia seriolae TaxID=37332 RepID=A0A0B8N109_9NOCA|nr:hypothetical protein [Nocardia seriolae]APB01488.1 hypothetical protein NS506_07468 [Nocardia seriolae]MTJ61025.1 hypothetical protein [Nocardia seriolae]MTJ70514.1 hypothetical protein [Nocardia seriolae]MTJ90843.1 hypothetical protein [Nocardia seriolae]MTK34799.1 hypothetical protein [Nocardia seriolae]
MAISIPAYHPRPAAMRRILLTVVTGSLVFLIPWIVYLSVSLPSERQVDQWDIAWVGFDFALAGAIGMTAWTAWRRRQIFIPWAMITGTLLVCDAWFDIALNWNTPELWFAVLSAIAGELPLAALLFYAARRLLRLTVERAWALTGHTGPAPRVSRIEMLVTASWLQREPEDPDGSDVQGRTGIDAADRARQGVAQRVDAEA